MSKTFADGHEERIHYMALATTTDFYNMVRYKPNACLPAHNAERKYLVEQISSVLKTNAKKRIERHTNATKDINCMMVGTDDATTYAVDVMGVFGGDNAELLFLEQSGGSCFEKSRPHAKGDSIKVANESINGLRARLCKFLDVPVELAKKRLTLSATTVIEAKAVPRAMQVPAPDRAVTVLLEKNPVIGTWKNVEPLLHIATKQPRGESTRSLCAEFLSCKPGAHWIRVWYLAEKYDLPLLLSEKHYGNLPHNRWNDPFFAKLSDKFRSSLLLARVQNTWLVSYNVRGASTEPFKIGQKCGSNYPFSVSTRVYSNYSSSDATRVYAPDALTTRDIAATVDKRRMPYESRYCCHRDQALPLPG
ncbi:hypothetical protein HDU88_007052 [Geranomyces variabilis]|nr:hypothetical protein HDU88_007052 [Geranomyces variabilis]